MTKKQLEEQNRRLRKALLTLVYDDDGRWRVGVKDDWDVTKDVKPALEYRPRGKNGQMRHI